MSKPRVPAVSANMIAVTSIGGAGLVAKGQAQPVRTYGHQIPTVPSFSAETPPAPSPTPVSFSAETAWPPAAGTTLTVKISTCADNKYNARTKYFPSVIKERAASIAAEGQKVPAPAMAIGGQPGQFMLIDGGYRKRALLSLGRDEINIVIEEVRSEKDLYRLSRMFNKERDNGSALDDALAWKKLLDDGIVADQNELSVLTGEEKGTISKTLSILKLPEEAIEAISEHPSGIGPIVGYELYLYSKGAGPEELTAAVSRVLSGELSTRDLEQLRKRPEEPHAEKRTREVSRTHRIKNGEGVEIGTLKDWDNGRVALELRIEDPNQRAELVEELKRRWAVKGG